MSKIDFKKFMTPQVQLTKKAAQLIAKKQANKLVKKIVPKIKR